MPAPHRQATDLQKVAPGVAIGRGRWFLAKGWKAWRDSFV